MAARFFINGGVDNNWSTIGNWSLTDGGSGGQTVPSASDDVHFTGNSPNCTVNTSARVCLSLDFTGYINTITMSQQITVSGSVTLVPGMTISGTGAMIIGGSSVAPTLTSGGKTWPNAFSVSTFGTSTFTLADTWTIGGLLTLGTSGSTLWTINGFSFVPLAGVRFGGTSNRVLGTTVLNLTVSQTLDAPSLLSTGAGILLPITINAPGGTITVSGSFPIDFSKLTYTAGSVVTANTWPSSSRIMRMSRVRTGM